MPNTPRKHFDEDIERATEILGLSEEIETGNVAQRLCLDLRLSALGMAVGAMDAYFCDKYIDCLTCALRRYKNNGWPGTFPSRYAKALLPVGISWDPSRSKRPDWGVRMAARSAMEKDNMYSLSRVPEAFNPNLPQKGKLWDDIIEDFIRLDRKRLTGIRWAAYSNLRGPAKHKAKNRAREYLVGRIGKTVQYRHDWVHNCGRPKEAITELTVGQVRTRIKEIGLVVGMVDNFIEFHRIAK